MDMLFLKKQQGSAAVLALGVMLFAGIIISGLLPMISTQVYLAPRNRDVIEAQYAAESGVKRAIVEFNQPSGPNWDWVDSASSINWRYYIDNSTANAEKRYHVTIKMKNPQTGIENIIVPDSPVEEGTYTITSTAIVGGVTKIATAVATVSGGSGNNLDSSDPNSPAHYTIFAGGSFTMNGNNYALNGAPIGVRGEKGGHEKADPKILYNHTNISLLPSYTILTAALDPNRPVINLNSSTSNISKNYSYQTLIYNGDVTINPNSNFDHVTIYATGTITIKDNNGNSGGQNIKNSYIVAGTNMTMSGAPDLSNTVIAVSGSFTANGGVNLNGGSILVGGDARINGGGNTNLNYSKSALDNYFTGGSTGPTITITSWSGT